MVRSAKAAPIHMGMRGNCGGGNTTNLISKALILLQHIQSTNLILQVTLTRIELQPMAEWLLKPSNPSECGDTPEQDRTPECPKNIKMLHFKAKTCCKPGAGSLRKTLLIPG